MTLCDFFFSCDEEKQRSSFQRNKKTFSLVFLQLEHEIYVQHILCSQTFSFFFLSLRHFVKLNFTTFSKSRKEGMRTVLAPTEPNEILISQTNRFIANNWLNAAGCNIETCFNAFLLIQLASIETQNNRLREEEEKENKKRIGLWSTIKNC